MLFLLYSTRGIPSHCPGSIYFEPLHLPLCILIKQSDSRPSLAPRSGSHCWGYQVIHQPSKSVQGMITDNLSHLPAGSLEMASSVCWKIHFGVYSAYLLCNGNNNCCLCLAFTLKFIICNHPQDRF